MAKVSPEDLGFKKIFEIDSLSLPRKSGNGEIAYHDRLMRKGQKKIPFEKLDEYCKYKQTKNFLMKKFKKLGYVPDFYVKKVGVNDKYGHYFTVSVIRYYHRGKLYETPSVMPFSRCLTQKAYDRFSID